MELTRLRAVRGSFKARSDAIADLCEAARALKSSLVKPNLKDWRGEIGGGKLGECVLYLNEMDVETLRKHCDEEQLKKIEDNFLPIVEAAGVASSDAPSDVKQLLGDQAIIVAAKTAIEAHNLAGELARVEALLSLVRALEQSTREGIRRRSNEVIAEISEDIKSMWSILHPGEAIEDVHLYLPDDADKAIDIALKFYGKELDSPRLTLSEGYRNGLGLCIFLAMAKREAKDDRPIFLDDVVISLDRSHRGMIVEILEREFAARQIILLTHDRDWYIELRQQLDPRAWTFRALLPYETPTIGIRWSQKTTTFDDARAHLGDRPDSAGNDVRKIMDVELSVIAERLRISLPYLRLDKNDRRMAHEFLERLVADGQKRFQKRTAASGFTVASEEIEAMRTADKLLLSWANRASHSFDVVRPEAAKLIETSEKALESLVCPSCRKPVWFANAETQEWTQCQCGNIRWRYGKT